MSEGDDRQVLPIILRASTPAADEKVLLYLEGLNRNSSQYPHAPPSNPPSDLGSEVGMRMLEQQELDRQYAGDRSVTPSARGGRIEPVRLNTLQDLAGSELGWNDLQQLPPIDQEDEIASDVQEQSELSQEPGPQDPPHGFYHSGSSWGNKGPLPDSRHASYQKPAAVPLPKSVMSPKTGTMSIPPQEGATTPKRSQAASRASQRSRATMQEEPERKSEAPPHKSSKSQLSQVSRTKTAEPDEGAKSAVSRHQKQKSFAPSHISQAPSLSPSDSPSNIGFKRAQAARSQPRPTEPAQPAQRSKSRLNEVTQASRDPSREPSPVRSPARSQPQQLYSPQPSRAFSPHRGNPTGSDLFQAMRNAAGSPARSQATIPATEGALGLGSIAAPPQSIPDRDQDNTPRAMSPDGRMTSAEEQIISDILTGRTPNRTSYAPSNIEAEVKDSHYHDMELCVLLHNLDDPNQHEVTKKVLRKAVRQRVKKLGLKYDHDSIDQFRKSFHDHDPSEHIRRHLTGGTAMPEEAPAWAKEILEGIAVLRSHIDNQIESIKSNSQVGGSQPGFTPSERERYGSSIAPTTQMHTQQPGTSEFNPDETDVRESVMPGPTIGSMHQQDGSVRVDEEDFIDDETQRRGVSTREDDDTHLQSAYYQQDGRFESPGAQYLDEEIYKLRVRPTSLGLTHKTWEITPEQGEYDDEEEGENQIAVTESGMPEIHGTQTGGYTETGRTSPPLPPIPHEQEATYADPNQDVSPPWQRIHQRLLSWAIVWPMSQLDSALNSTTRGNQIDEIALSIWSTQTYKRYVRSKMTDNPNGSVDRLFVPPNMADAISNAVYSGRHGDACAILRELWSPFGFAGVPRLLIVLAKHRSDDNHWVVHRFHLLEGSLATYDTYPERALPDGRPLGWWFAIRIAWPNTMYPSPDHLMQKMVRLHRPMQLGIDNSVAAAGIWRNLLMGSRAERSLDLERLRDLINTEVKNLRQRKVLGKLSTSSNTRGQWAY